MVDAVDVFGYTISLTSAIARADALMAADGFIPGRLDNAAVTMDRHVAQELQCPACGNLGHELRAYVRGRQYRAMAICLGCAATSEF